MEKRRVILAAGLMMALTGGSMLAFTQTNPPQPQQGGSPVVSVPATIPQPSPSQPVQNAVAVKEVGSPAAPSHAADQAIWALMVSLLIQYLKKARWFTAFSDQTSSRVKAMIGFVAALLTAAGIHFVISGSIFDGGGATITVTGFSINALRDVAWQWASQQAWYRAVVKEPQEIAVVPPAPPKV